jgi:hypothetical protein
VCRIVDLVDTQPCSTCDGAGTITRSRALQLRAAWWLKMRRLRGGRTLPEEAARLGIGVETLVEYESAARDPRVLLRARTVDALDRHDPPC